MEHFKKDEMMPHIEGIKTSMFERIDGLRLFAIQAESVDYLNELSDEIYGFDQELQQTLTEKFGNENLRRMVPEWHKLVGSTPEDHEVDPAAKEFIAKQVEEFVAKMESKWQL